MKNFTNPQELYDFLSEASATDGLSYKDIRDQVKTQILALDEVWKKAVADKDKELTDKASVLSTVSAELTSIKAELESLKSAADKQAKQDILDQRLSKIEDKYNLDDKARKVIAKNIFELSEAEFDSWQAEDGEVLLAGKEKKLEVSLQDGLNKSTASVNHVPNTASVSAEQVNETKTVLVTRDKGMNFKISVK